MDRSSDARKPVSFTGSAEASRHPGVHWLELNQPPPRSDG
jgi:hypothetical protein